MVRLNKRGEQIRHFILQNVRSHPKEIIRVTASEFGVTKQAIRKHVVKLVEQGSIAQSGKGRNTAYQIGNHITDVQTYEINDTFAEDKIWQNNVWPLVINLPNNVEEILHYGFTEMLNNVIDHSSSNEVTISIEKDYAHTEIRIYDFGIGIFKKIKDGIDLEDERHAVLELSKGKLTTDPSNHSGEGIFFSSRMFDLFCILSGDVYFSHQFDKVEDWIISLEEDVRENIPGTTVLMKIDNNTSRTMKKVFDQYTSKEDFKFSRTVVPVALAQYGDDLLVSRSQAKRLLARVDRFKVVMFDFKGVDAIGQAFADEIFRVFASNHPEIEIHHIQANEKVTEMILHVIE